LISVVRNILIAMYNVGSFSILSSSYECLNEFPAVLAGEAFSLNGLSRLFEEYSYDPAPLALINGDLELCNNYNGVVSICL